MQLTLLLYLVPKMNFRIEFFFSSLVMFLLTTTISSSNGGNETDYWALLQLKSMITLDPSESLSSWNASFHFCDWSGVICGKRHRRVIALNMFSQGLQGSISPYVGNLSFLRGLFLWNNSFHGTLPHELGRLSRLRYLQLGSNKFNGVIPTNLSGCSNIEIIGLYENNLLGSIPKEIGFLSKLTFILLQYNNLTGGIPAFLGNLTSMKVFNAFYNPLGGSIPDTFGNWKNLTEFSLGYTNLNGTIPHSIYNLSLLITFSLAENQLVGSLPSTLCEMLPHLEYLQLRNNQLTGSLPPSISNCSKLGLLEVNNNNFSGKLRIDFSKLNDIQSITLGDNVYGFGEADDMKFIDTMKKCSRLERLDLRNCKFQGLLPASIGNLSDQLRLLVILRNNLYGNLPSSIGNLVGLEVLVLSNNQFTGKIPYTISKLKNLQIAYLDRNQFSGPIPDAIGNLSLLTKLWLHSNRLDGHIPSSLGNCHNLLELKLDDNKLSSQIPKQLLQLLSLTIALDLSKNNLFGSIPIEVGDLKMLTSLDLSNNNLSGSIPSSLGGCISLSFLSLKGNLFNGMVPPSLSSMRGVSKLDLSHNNLSGQIPQFLQRLILLEYVNLSFNDFEGEVPMTGVFANASAFSVLGNSRLCGGLVELGLLKCKETRKAKKRFPLFAIVILIAFIVFTVLCFVYVWCMKRKGQPYQSSTDEQFMKISYTQLFKATNGFSEENLIGKGGFSSVYKGILKHDDGYVAVKVMHLQNRGAHKSFVTECEAWQSIRHRNLLKIMTSCSSVDFQGNDFKALVYEFMPNGSLHDWLHSPASKSRLTLLQRINILLDVAFALDYLHNHCISTIVHCDLKPSNILLDDDTVAHVGDFGLTRFLGTHANENSTTVIRGTIGYAPPEYGLGSEMATSGDVYSFGILVLEVMTGKMPTDNIFGEDLNLHKFAYTTLPDSITNIIDDDILPFLQEDAISKQGKLENANNIEHCVASIIKIGVSCSADSPPQRMNIKNVVHGLQHILETLQNI
ncbi:receptor kinase-like protein Xa21 [Lactuca sativa]|uniref:receptor kinase-like protein Xa21 n=1 Tax=Lactuca sativa TaxID=4236 RepID=UPI000CD84749|nr:receptor kinase-like protein Xa21 [Lactuca sativa]